jgi:hypothetical protein
MSDEISTGVSGEPSPLLLEIASLCDRACATVETTSSVSGEFARLTQTSTNDLIADYESGKQAVEAIVAAFQYTLRVQSDTRSRLRDSFAPMASFLDGRQIPPQVSDLPEDVISIWIGVASQVRHPGASSRLNDLLFVRGGVSRAGSYAKAAIDGYLALKDTNWTALEITRGLLRALQLARGVRDETRVTQAIADTISHYWSNIQASAPPGVTIPLIEGLFGLANQGDVIDHMISSARSLYADPHIEDQLLSWQIGRARDPLNRQRYTRERVQVWLKAADQAAPLIKVMYLETAAQYVDDVSDPELKQSVKSMLQNAGRDDLGLKTTVDTISLPQDEVEQYIGQFVAPDEWQGAIELFSRHPPPTGDYEENVRLANEIDDAAPLQSVISRVRLGGDGLPRWRPVTEEDREDARLARIEEYQATLRGNLLAQVLREIGRHYSKPSRQTLVEYFATRPNIAPGTAEQLGTAIDLFWKGEESAALYIAVWLVESLLRNLILQSDEGIYSVQRRHKPGQYPGLGFLLKKLSALGLDQSWYRYFWTVFASPAGLNMRNEIAHGFGGRSGPGAAALAIHASCFLTTIRVNRS